jgi:hypothetical protein
MSEFEKYDHHGTEVSVRKDLKGKHREHCLCFSCEKFKLGTPDKCPVANSLFTFCVLHDLVTPVYECPLFKEKTNV